MRNLWKRMFGEYAVIVIVPGAFIILGIIAFLIYGFADPIRSEVPHATTLLEDQYARERVFRDAYRDGSYSEINPYFIRDPYGMSPLTGLILFDTDEATRYVVRVLGKSEEATLEFHTPLATVHQIPVLGLYAGYSNVIQLYAYDAQTDGPGDLLTTITTQTPSLPDTIPTPESMVTTHAFFGDDWMVMVPSTDQHAMAYDAFGDVRWYLTTSFAGVMEPLANGHFLVPTERFVQEPYYATGLYEIDLLGKIHVEYQVPGGVYGDVTELPGGNLLTISNTFTTGVQDLVIEIERTTGRVLRSWDMNDYLDIADGFNQMFTLDDWVHVTSVAYDANDDLILIASRHKDAVIAIDRLTDELVYLLGDKTRWAAAKAPLFLELADDSDWFYGPSSIEVMDDGRLLLFDNGNHRSKLIPNDVPPATNRSYARVYDIDRAGHAVTLDATPGSSISALSYSPYLSNAAQLAQDTYLIHSGGIASTLSGTIGVAAPLYDGEGALSQRSVTVIIEDEEQVYFLRVATNVAKALRIDPYGPQTRVVFGEAAVRGQQQVATPYEQPITERLTVFETVPPNYDLTLVKDRDRLVVEGRFDIDQTVFLVLRDASGETMYHIPITPSRQSALAPPISEVERVAVTYHLNEYERSGTYSILLIIDGHRYDTYTEVTFD